LLLLALLLDIFTHIFYKKPFNCTCFCTKNTYINMYQHGADINQTKKG
tara:strand:- start:185 stop:328 length:144 start_codon:yes stop_codon:yes gene_type:complete